MEKFAVDLDKVLDDFEFHEEQAIRHHLKEDLPAKKYQRPPFQRINLADADFSPSKQTSSPVLSYITEPSSNIVPVSNGSSEHHNNFSNTSEDDLIANEDVLVDIKETSQPKPDLLGDDIYSDSMVFLNLPDLTETTIEAVNNPDLVPGADDSGDKTINESHIKLEHKTIIEINDTSSTILVDTEPIIVEPFLSEVTQNGSLDDDKKSTEETYATEIIITSNETDQLVEQITEEEENVVENVEEEKMVVNISNNKCGTVDPDCANKSYLKYTNTDIDDDELESLLEVLEESDRRLPECEESAASSDNVIEEVKDEKESEEVVVVVGQDVAESSLLVVDEVKEEECPQRPSFLKLAGTDATNVEAVAVASVSDASVSEDRDNIINEAALETRQTQETKPEAPINETVNVDAILADSPPLLSEEERKLGKVTPFWVPDEDAHNCMQCGLKFTVIKRRHHCRACGRVLCNKCCGMRACLEYLNNQEQRVCELCFRTLTKVMMYEETDSDAEASPRRRPNPNNPMEYCSTVPPPLQASPSGSQPPPSVLVPVLKREGSSKNKETPKKVMFSDGIRPGGDLTSLDEPPPPSVQRALSSSKRSSSSRAGGPAARNLPPVDPASKSFVIENRVPPICEISNGVKTYKAGLPNDELMERLRSTDQPPLLFAVNRHLVVSVRIVKLDCCTGKTCWVFSTRGMASVGQDEIIIVLELTDQPNEPVPCEIFMQLQDIYLSADKGKAVGELGYWSVKESTFLDSRQHGGFLFVRPSYQCVVNLDKPTPPYLVGILIHRLELPWARQFPLRLMLRLGAEFRYYPCTLVSVRHREPVYYEIGQTIMNLLADFRSYSFTLPAVSGLQIHMEAQQTTILIPKNRYDQVVRALNNSNDPVLALAGTFSPQADAHLVCMQSSGDEITYSTQAINILEKPRKVTGASFVVFHASLKSTAGVFGKFSIVEDGLMVEIRADTMSDLRARLRALQDWSVLCGVNNQENVQVTWCDDEKDFNRGVKSVIDGTPLDGVPSIRVHNGTDYMSGTRFIRWTEVFIIKCEDGATSAKIGDPLEINRLSESISCATCTALTKANLLDTLATSGNSIIALRTTVTQDSVCYEAGSNGEKLSGTFMKSLDNELIPVLHKATANNSDACASLELVFHILDQ